MLQVAHPERCGARNQPREGQELAQHHTAGGGLRAEATAAPPAPRHTHALLTLPAQSHEAEGAGPGPGLGASPGSLCLSLPHPPLPLDAFFQVTLLQGGWQGRGGNDLAASMHNGQVTVWSPARGRKEICPVFLACLPGLECGCGMERGEEGGSKRRREKVDRMNRKEEVKDEEEEG